MATITPTLVEGADSLTVATTTLTGSDDFVYNTGKRNILILSNATGGALQPTIVGSAATTRPCIGIGNIDVSSGKQLQSIADGDSATINLNSISGYLSGDLTVESGVGLTAQLLQI